MTPIARALDAAYPGWTVAELKAAGITAVGRYVGYGGKVIQKAEYDELIAGGIAVFLVWETTGKSWAGGYSAGLSEGREARRQARALGHPDACTIYQAVDEGVEPTSTLADYQRGFNEGGGVGVEGVYGDVHVGEYLLGLNLVSKFWETNARGWPGDAIDDPRAVMVQRYALTVPFVGGSYDVDDVYAPDFGQNPRPHVTPAPPPAKPIPPVTRTIPGVTMQVTRVVTMPLDPQGNGTVDVPGVPYAKRIGVSLDGVHNPPDKPAGYVTMPRFGFDEIATVLRIVVEGGVPGGRYVFLVSHA